MLPQTGTVIYFLFLFLYSWGWDATSTHGWLVSFHYFIIVLILTDLKGKKNKKTKKLRLFITKLIKHFRFVQSMKVQYHSRISSHTHLLFRNNNCKLLRNDFPVSEGLMDWANVTFQKYCQLCFYHILQYTIF